MLALDVKPFRQTPGLCGPSCLKMVLNFYGYAVSEKRVQKLSGATTQAGASSQQLVHAAKRLGYQTQVYTHGTFKQLAHCLKQGTPPIVDCFSGDDGHYSVAIKLTPQFIFLQDPELGAVRKMDRKTFLRVWFDFPGGIIRQPSDLILREFMVIEPKVKRS